MLFEVFCFGDGDFLTSLFRGVSAMVGHQDFRFAMMLVVSYAFMTMLLMAMLKGQLLDVRWFFGVMLIYALLLVPKVSVSIEDRLQSGWGGAPVVHEVGDIPIGLAFMASVSSKLGDWLTSTMETVFSLPSGLNYEDNGPLFAASMAQSISSYSLTNPETQTALQNFWHNCVFYDLALGFYSMQSLMDASDLETFFRANAASNRGFDYIDPQGNHQILSCDQAFSGHLDLDIQQAVQSAQVFLPWRNQAVMTQQVITSAAQAMPIAFQYLSGLGLSASQALTQAALMNSFASGLSGAAAQTGSTAALSAYTQAVAEREHALDYGVLGRLSAKMLPVVRDVFEGFIDCVFPVIALMSMLPGGVRALLAYFRVQVWIALWPPIYAILNFAMIFFTSVAAQKAIQMCAAGYACAPSFSLATQPGFEEVLKMHAAVAGYLMTSIPMIAWLLVNQSGAMLASLAGRIMDSYAQPVSQAAHATATGNVTQGNIRLENVQAWHQSSAPHNESGYFTSNNGAFTVTANADGLVAKQNLSSLAMSRSWSAALERSFSEEHSSAVAELHRASDAVRQSNSQMYQSIVQMARSWDQSNEHRRQDSHDQTQMIDTINRAMDQGLRAYSHRTGKMHELDSTISAIFKITAEMPVYPIDVISDINFAMKNASTKQKQWANDFVSSQEFAHALDVSIKTMKSESNAHSDRSTREQLSSVSQQQQHEQQKVHAYEHARQQEEQTALRMQQVQQHRDELDVAMGNALLEGLQQQGMDWQKGLDDLARQHDSLEARQIRDWAIQQLDHKNGADPKP